MNIKEQSIEFDVRDETVDLMTEFKTKDKNIATAVKEAIEAPLETSDESTRRSDAVIPFKKREKHEENFEGIKSKPVYEFFKRLFDIVLSALASVVILIPVLIIAVIIMIKDPGNPFYIQTRVGKGYKPIKILKLRSMKMGADKLENVLTPEQLEEYKREYKLHDDPRLIGWKKPGDGRKCFGARIRQLSIDEVMQIPYNILIKNDLRLVGPRPILREELEKYYTPEQQKVLLSVKPGLTGYWQAYARNNAKYDTGERQKMELYYIERRSFLMDIKIILATVSAVVKKNGAE